MKPAASHDARGPALLVVQTSFLGDVVLTTPLVSALRRRLVPRRLALLVRPEAVPLVAGHPAIDQVLGDDKRGADRGAPGWLRTAPRPSARGSQGARSPHRPLSTAPALAGRRGGGARGVVLGAPDGGAPAEEINRLAGGRATVLAGRTDLATLVAVVDRLALLVANDSAPMHIACARGVPVVAVFCATTPALGYGPWGPRAAVVEADLACRPCGRHGGRSCPRGTEDCMRLVRPGAVLAAARAGPGAPPAAGPPPLRGPPGAGARGRFRGVGGGRRRG